MGCAYGGGVRGNSGSRVKPGMTVKLKSMSSRPPSRDLQMVRAASNLRLTTAHSSGGPGHRLRRFRDDGHINWECRASGSRGGAEALGTRRDVGALNSGTHYYLKISNVSPN